MIILGWFSFCWMCLSCLYNIYNNKNDGLTRVVSTVIHILIAIYILLTLIR